MTKWLLLFVLPIGLADSPEPPVAPVEIPKIFELSPTPVAPVDVAAPLPLTKLHYRWFSIKNYTGATTWEIDVDNVVKVIEVDKPNGFVIGAVEGTDEPTKNDVPLGAVVVTPYGTKEGLVKLVAYGVVNGKAKRLDSIKLLVGPLPPPPLPPVPPLPPTPPQPVNPLPSPTLKVLMLYERQDKLSKEQTAMFSSEPVHNAITKAGGSWHCWSYTDDTSKESQWWQDAAKRPHSGVAWVVISSPKGFYEGSPPASPADFITLVGKY